MAAKVRRRGRGGASTAPWTRRLAPLTSMLHGLRLLRLLHLLALLLAKAPLVVELPQEPCRRHGPLRWYWLLLPPLLLLLLLLLL